MVQGRDATDRLSRRRSLRTPILIASFTLIAAWALLQGQAKVLQSMAPPGCTASGPASLQGGLGAASRSDAAEIVTGWHAFTRASHGDAPAPMYLPSSTSAGCVSTPRARPDNVLGTSNGDTIARVWLVTDLVLYAPAYAVLLLLVLAWVRTQDLEPTPAGEVRPELPLLRGAIWLARQRAMSALVIVALLADWSENALLLHRLGGWWTVLDRTGRLPVGDLHLGLVRTAGVIKWLALVAPLVVVAVFALRQLVRAAALVRRALPRLWVHAGLVTVFAALVLVPDQGADALRRLSAWQWVSTLLVIALFVVVIVLGAGEVLKPKDPTEVPDPPPQRGRHGRGALWHALVAARWGAAVTAIGVGIWVASRITGFGGLVVPAALIGLVGVISMVLDAVDDVGDLIPGIVRPDVAAATQAGRVAAAMPAAAARDAAVARVAPCLSAVIVGAFGFATLRASAGDLALFGSGPHHRLLLRVVLGFVVTVSTGLVVQASRRLLVRAAAWSDKQRLVVLVVLLVVHTPAIAFHDPDLNLAGAAIFGTFSLVAVFLSGFSLIGSAAARASNVLMRRRRLASIALPSALRMLRLRATPITGLLVAWALLVPIVGGSSYHSVRQWPASPPAPLSIDALTARWIADRASTTGPAPALLVAASGGGIRAAYWTAAVLDCVIERSSTGADPCAADAPATTVAARRRALLAMSGISGGSLGLVEYVTAVGKQWDPGTPTALQSAWYRRRLGADFLSPTIAGWLFNDGANALLRPDEGVDRAAVMERALQRTWPDDELGAPFFTGQRGGHQPALLLNGFSVGDGCRVLTSPLETQPQRTAADCTRVATNGPAPAVLSTVDVGAQLCADRDFGYATAALASARFPLISPAGRLEGCGDGGSPVNVVDGGYRETSGASTLVELWPELQAGLAAAAPQGCVSPVFLQIDNGYASDQVSGVGGGAVGQVLAPLRAVFSASSGEEAAAREASRQLFGGAERGNWFRITTYAHPGSTAPLGWVLSSDAMNDLERQLVVNAPTITAIRNVLDHPTPCS
jgi:hypothetical protein